ncbi:hypothetical protein QBC38DRAFT_486123 [Podospora fimiseda]|uniref:SnoaL-like domain-containing protein n=1 Tax=Podospora fimiseda TaxID=252190 RepID=A0AAN7BIQ9_9PEZI|nr:hypothetical protein QBC38DRAFT_486123 [Podospora fimiseda]
MATTTRQLPTLPEETTASIKTFLKHFYTISDNQELNNEWVNYYTEEATLIMGISVAKGLKEIGTLRESMWKTVVSRQHSVEKVFVGCVEGEEEVEISIFGRVMYRLRGGGDEEGSEWSATGRLVKRRVVEGEEEGKLWKWREYRVFLRGEMVVL